MPIPADTRIVFLDLDRTLLDDRNLRASHRQAMTTVADRFGFDAEEAMTEMSNLRKSAWTPELQEAWMRGSLGGRNLIRESWASLLAGHGILDSAEVDRAMHDHMAAQDAGWVLYDDVLPFLDEMDAAGISMGIITNGHPDLQLRKVDVLGLAPRMASITVSGSHGVPKPDPKIFEHAFDATGLGRVPAVHVGDSLEADIAGATAAGIGAIWLDRDGERDGDAEPDATIHSLAELPILLGLPEKAERAAARG